MDHAIEWLSDYMEMDKQNFIEEWQSGQYKKISDCPHYEAIKAYCDARNTLSKYYYGKAEYETPKDIIYNIMEGA